MDGEIEVVSFYFVYTYPALLVLFKILLQNVHQGWYINSVDHCVLRLVITLEHQTVMHTVDVLKVVSVLMAKCCTMKDVSIQ